MFQSPSIPPSRCHECGYPRFDRTSVCTECGTAPIPGGRPALSQQAREGLRAGIWAHLVSVIVAFIAVGLAITGGPVVAGGPIALCLGTAAGACTIFALAGVFRTPWVPLLTLSVLPFLVIQLMVPGAAGGPAGGPAMGSGIVDVVWAASWIALLATPLFVLAGVAWRMRGVMPGFGSLSISLMTCGGVLNVVGDGALVLAVIPGVRLPPEIVDLVLGAMLVLWVLFVVAGLVQIETGLRMLGREERAARAAWGEHLPVFQTATPWDHMGMR